MTVLSLQLERKERRDDRKGEEHCVREMNSREKRRQCSELHGGPAQSTSTFKSRECVNMALFAKGFFGDVIKNLERRPSHIG